MACPHVKSCPLYPVFGVKALLRVWQLSYCEADYAKCARYQLACEGGHVPDTLLPSGAHLKARRAGESGAAG